MTSPNSTGSFEMSSTKTSDFLDLHRHKIQVKLLEDNYPFTNISANYTSHQHVLKWIYNGNDGGFVKQDTMTEPLDNMYCCQCKFLNMRVVELWSNQASAQVINDIFFKQIILLNQDHTYGRLCTGQIQ
jgi:hypothetical protein